MHGIVERPDVGIDFFLQVTRQVAQTFAGFHNGAGKHNAALLVAQHQPERLGNGKECFAAAGGAFRQHQVAGTQQVHQFRLPPRARIDLAGSAGHHNAALLEQRPVPRGRRTELRHVCMQDGLHQVGVRNSGTTVRKFVQNAVNDKAETLLHLRVPAVHGQFISAGKDRNPKKGFDEL